MMMRIMMMVMMMTKTGYVISGTQNGLGARHNYFALSAMPVDRGGDDES